MLEGVPEAANLQLLTVMMCDPQRPATIVPGRGNHRRWEFMLLPGEDDREMMQPRKVAELVAPWLGGVDHRIVRAATYRFHGLIAKQWQVGNVFLAGDAAHQTPPFFGQGMCHGLRDVANLAWKMAMIARGHAPQSLLDSYQTERDPHVRAVIWAAVEAGRYICELDPVAAARRDATMRERARQTGHSTAADLIPPVLDGIVAPGQGRVGERFIQPRVETGEGPCLLDDVGGGGWRLFVADADAAQVARVAVGDRDVAVIDASALGDAGAIRQWLAARNTRAVLVRPDFYVFGVADDPALLIRWLADAIGEPSPVKEKAA
jgi:3-(3-hydroxy-phenyl)propionate hydroxylase